MINEKLVRNILSSNKSCKKYHIKPNVEFSRISEIVMNESEANMEILLFCADTLKMLELKFSLIR